MNWQVWKRPLAGGLAIAAGLLALPYTVAQPPDVGDILIERRDPGPPGPERVPLDVMQLRAEGGKRRVIALHNAPDDMRELREAAAAVHNAEDDRSKRQAQDRLEDMLDRYFDNDIRRRERELEDIEQRLKKLEAALERRREKRREIVDLQAQVLLNEADGLGFFGGDNLITTERPVGFHFEAHPAMKPHPPAPAVIVAPPVAVRATTEPAPAPAPPRQPAPRRQRGRERVWERDRDQENEWDVEPEVENEEEVKNEREPF